MYVTSSNIFSELFHVYTGSKGCSLNIKATSSSRFSEFFHVYTGSKEYPFQGAMSGE
jgi:hypothetical protein